MNRSMGCSGHPVSFTDGGGTDRTGCQAQWLRLRASSWKVSPGSAEAAADSVQGAPIFTHSISDWICVSESAPVGGISAGRP